MKKRQKTPDIHAIAKFCAEGDTALAALVERFVRVLMQSDIKVASSALENAERGQNGLKI
jgi:hypothetical protein